MADLSKIVLPSGSTYEIKDAVAREAIAAGFSYEIANNAATTPKGIQWKSGNTTITGTLEASASTRGKFYLVPSLSSLSGDSDIYDEYITLGTSTFTWEKIGNTRIDIGNLGSLAYKSSATGSVTPSGTVSKPDITVSVTPSTTTKYVATSASGGGSVTNGKAASCTLPNLSMTVSNETLTFNWSAGSFSANTPTAVTLPSFSSQTIATGISSATGSSSQPTFSGTAASVTVQ